MAETLLFITGVLTGIIVEFLFARRTRGSAAPNGSSDASDAYFISNDKRPQVVPCSLCRLRIGTFAAQFCGVNAGKPDLFSSACTAGIAVVAGGDVIVAIEEQVKFNTYMGL